jgi:hypothetical protein
MEKRVAKKKKEMALKKKEMALKKKDYRDSRDSARQPSQKGSGITSLPYDSQGVRSAHSAFDPQEPDRDLTGGSG